MTRSHGDKLATIFDLWRGRRVIWRHKPRGGYGFVLRIPVAVEEFESMHAVHVRIEATGEVVAIAMQHLVIPISMLVDDGTRAELPGADE